MSELKPCPFCGGKAYYDWGGMTEIGGSEYQAGEVCCGNEKCQAMVEVESVDGSHKTRDLIEKWNNRAESQENQSLKQQVAELVAAFDRLDSCDIDDADDAYDDMLELVSKIKESE